MKSLHFKSTKLLAVLLTASSSPIQSSKFSSKYSMQYNNPLHGQSDG